MSGESGIIVSLDIFILYICITEDDWLLDIKPKYLVKFSTVNFF